MHDVIVVGAGPVGCYLAAETARAGLDVALIDRKNGASDAPICTGIIGSEAFGRFDLPLDTVVNGIKDVRFFAPSGESIAFQPPETQAYVVDRTRFDKVLHDRARSLGATARTGLACSGVSFHPSHVAVETNRGEIHARLLVLASGHSPGLISGLQLGRTPSLFQGVQCEVAIDEHVETEIYVGNGVAPASFAWVVGLGNGAARVGLTAKRNAGALLEKFLNTPSLGPRIRSRGPIRRKPIPFGALGKTYADRLMVVGEAAGQVKTTTHGGIYFGLIGARHAAETALDAFRENDFSAGMLRRYDQRWREELEGEISRGMLLRSLFSRLSDRRIDGLFKLVHQDGIMGIIHRKARFDWHDELISSLMEHAFFPRFFGKRTRKTGSAAATA